MNRWLVLSMVLAVLATLGTLGVYFGLYDRLADEIPLHWNVQGEVDKRVPREQALPWLLILPAVMVGIVGLTFLLPWLSPRHFEVDRFRGTYHFIMALVTAMLGYLHLIGLLAALDVPIDINRWVLGGMFLALALLGNVLGKVQRNFWIGIRTPWTLASERVWIATHRLGAYCFTLGALLGFALAMAGAPIWLAMSAFGVCALVPIVYSLVLYKRLEREGQL